MEKINSFFEAKFSTSRALLQVACVLLCFEQFHSCFLELYSSLGSTGGAYPFQITGSGTFLSVTGTFPTVTWADNGLDTWFYAVDTGSGQYYIRSSKTNDYVDCSDPTFPKMLASPTANSVFQLLSCLLVNVYFACKNNGNDFIPYLPYGVNAQFNPGYTMGLPDIVTVSQVYVPIANCQAAGRASNGQNICGFCNAGFYVNATNSQCYSSTCSDAQCTICKTTTNCIMCAANYYVNATNTQCYSNICPFSCAVCQTPTACAYCVANYHLNATDSQCYSNACPSNCAVCQVSATCLYCNNNYYVNSTNSLCYSSIKPPNCAVSTVPTTCLFCNTGFYVNATNSLCYSSTCPFSCSICQDPALCLFCAASYHLNATDSQCYSDTCSSNCAVCQIPTACLYCNSGFYVNSTDSKCYSSTRPSNCAVSAVPTTCLYCNSGFYVNSTNSLCYSYTCPLSCTVCQDPALCLFCTSGFYVNATNSLCYSYVCADAYCGVCGQPAACVGCINTYFLAPADGLCYSHSCSDTQCTLCRNKAVCLSCNTAFYLNSTDAHCYSGTCIYGCSVCTTTSSCLYCAAGFHLNATDAQCYSDVCDEPSCATCIHQSTCLSCASGAVFAGSLCYLLSCPQTHCLLCRPASNCTSCAAGYFVLNQQCYASTCNVPNCQLCFEPEVCSVCVPPFANVNGRCFHNLDGALCDLCTEPIPCFAHSITSSLNATVSACSSADCNNCLSSNLCTVCVSSAIVTSAVCLSSVCLRRPLLTFDVPGNAVDVVANTDCWDADCKLCADMRVCDVCNPTFILIAGRCAPPTADYLCSGGNLDCVWCDSLQALVSAFVCSQMTCVDPSCSVCVTPSKCAYCYPNFIRMKNECDYDGTPCEVGTYITFKGCRNCILDFAHCASCSASECLSCLHGFVMSPYGCVPELCAINYCAACIDGVCVRCEPGYFLTAFGSCQFMIVCPLTSCDVCPSYDKCIDCNLSSFLSSASCFLQCSIPNCLLCAEMNICNSCKAGYQLVSNSCVAESCPDKWCSECPMLSKCATCTVGAVSLSGICLSADCAVSCVLCDSFGTCLQCQIGYERIGAVCVSLQCFVDNCRACDVNGLCVQCVAGFFVDPNGNCEELWMYCEPGHLYVNGECQRCPVGCLACASLSECLNCVAPLQNQNGVCVLNSTALINNSLNPSCFGLACQVGRERMNDNCPQCLVDCPISLDKTGRTAFEFSCPLIDFKAADSASYFFEVVSGSNKLSLTAKRSSQQVIIFTMTDDFIERTSCKLLKNKFYFLKMDPMSGTSVDSSNAVIDSLVVITEVITALNYILPVLLSFFQYSMLLRLYFFVSFNKTSWYSFINGYMIDEGDMASLMRPKDASVYAFLYDNNGSIVKYFLNPTKKWFVNTYTVVALSLQLIHFLFYRLKFYTIVWVTHLVNVNRVFEVFNRILESVILGSHLEIVTSIFIMVKLSAYQSIIRADLQTLFNFINLIVAFAFYVSTALNTWNEYRAFVPNQNLYLTQQMTSKVIMIVDLICTFLAFLIVASFHRYFLACTIMFVLLEIFKLLASSFLWWRLKDLGMLLLSFSEIFFIVYVFFLWFGNSSDPNFAIVGNIIYLMINVGRIANVVHVVYVIVKFKKIFDNLFDFDFV